MLILTRKSDESIWIGETICITVAEVKDKQVKVDIQAPGEFKGQFTMQSFTQEGDDKISIGESIHIKIVEIRGNQVRLGIEAPSEFLILRGEMKLREHDKPIEPKE
jgi:carbon storage regulator CsrA